MYTVGTMYRVVDDLKPWLRCRAAADRDEQKDTKKKLRPDERNQGACRDGAPQNGGSRRALIDILPLPPAPAPRASGP
jgi:hypothetical protein